MLKHTLFSLLLMAALVPARAQSGEAFLKSAQPLLPAPALLQLQPMSAKAKVEWLPADAPQESVLRVTTEGPRPKGDGDIALKAQIPASFKVGDVVFLRFKVRCLKTEEESGAGQIASLVEMGDEPYTKTIWTRFPATAQWTEYTAPGRIGRDYPSGSLVLSLRVGYAPQVLEIKSLELWKLPPSTELAILPATKPPKYPGIEPNAPWRKEAEARIEKFRKQDLKITVLGADGKPLPNAKVRVEQTRHAFGFGTAISMRELIGYEKPSNTALYQSVLLGAFDVCGTENDLKWPVWELHRDRTLAGLEWLRQRGYSSIRGHVLLWPSFYANRTPKSVQEIASDPQKLRQVILDHVRDIVTATSPYVQEWDVINEPRLNHQILDLLGGESFMVDVFKEARRWLPNGKLYLNEALTFTPDSRIDELERVTKYLTAQGAPVDGIGIQCHYSGWVVTPPAQIVETVNRLSALGKAIRVTEFDVDCTDDELQAAYLRDFYTAVFSCPSVVGIQMWGFWEGRHWKSTAALWTQDWKVRPAGRAHLDLVRGAWWTRKLETTDAAGRCAVRGFKGEYRIITLMGEKVLDARPVSLGDSPVDLKITLSPEPKSAPANP